MSSKDVIARYEEERDREDIVDLHGKDCYYNVYNKNKRSQQFVKSVNKSNRKQKRKEEEELQQEMEREKKNILEKMKNAMKLMTAVTTERVITDSWEDVIDNELESIKICQICLEDYEDFEQKLQLPCCKHEYHTECLQGLHKAYRVYQSRRFSDVSVRFTFKQCPNCRKAFIMPPADSSN